MMEASKLAWALDQITGERLTVWSSFFRVVVLTHYMTMKLDPSQWLWSTVTAIPHAERFLDSFNDPLFNFIFDYFNQLLCSLPNLCNLLLIVIWLIKSCDAQLVRIDQFIHLFIYLIHQFIPSFITVSSISSIIP